MAPVIFTIGKKEITVREGRGFGKGPKSYQGFFLAETEEGAALLIGHGNRILSRVEGDAVVDVDGRQVPVKIRIVKE